MHADLTSTGTWGLRAGESHVLGHTAVSDQSTRTGVLLEWAIPVYSLGPAEASRGPIVNPQAAGQQARDILPHSSGTEVLTPATAPRLAEAL